MKEISLLPKVGDFAEDKDQAAAIRETEIRPCLDAGERIVLDFGGITLATQSFVHALISDLLRSGDDTELRQAFASHLAHASGDATNAILAAAGYNFRLLLTWLRLLLLRLLVALTVPARHQSA
jgi:hypothetical protein